MAGSTRKTSTPLRSVDSFSEGEAEDVVRKLNAASFDRSSRPPPDDPIDRKLDAKRVNECVKHFNAFSNTLAAGILAAAAIVPFIRDANADLDANAAQWCVIALGFHIFPYVLNFLVMQSEE
ncbi:hypothetical protein [Methylobacterium sp. J-070]|uniref:hypothetical protein n=1 Tax=Methylobacterium sp. J-070 TaxID=2836650 RepID=UPI001FB934BE|nr:hypothetical protein [Methylobacterium sp. J-070]MCJ2048536.1 hypothetical protein [Methylobacterium sp. J-070]